ncbi:energy transducer TonB [Fibrella forsythiae]|uniref:Energy transducer TonB n=1 Tax=Fibrella forsythiae TaxID=2817061 RepID=A0ABS3JG45_9BACT|nr:energy transducer TonB [Fibrella forsythiae]MBO0948983.1 energy transducer TonB [Fibrella forsythiae]
MSELLDTGSPEQKGAFINPAFPGGLPGLANYVRSNQRYLQPTQIACSQANVIVEFIVNTDGTTSDFIILAGLDPACNQEAIRLVESMPASTPGTLAGEPVGVKLVLPIRFS